MSTLQVVFIVGLFKIFCIEKAESNTLVGQKHKLHYHYETFNYTTLDFTHAESPAWDPDLNTLYWVDVLNQNVHAFEYTTKQHRLKHIGKGEVNIVLPIADSKRLLIGVQSSVYLLDWDEPLPSSLRFIAALDIGSPDNILNEGKADVKGRFWAGTKGPQYGDTVLPDQAALYSLEQPHFEPRVQLKPVSISNGIVWSLNNSILYYIDSDTRRIDAFDFDARKGRISKRRTIVDISKYNFMKTTPEPIPDGMTIDRDGCLWVALMFGGAVIRIDPDQKKVVAKISLPVSRVTSVVWVGDTLEELVVTTSRRNMDARELEREPYSGNLFILNKLGTGGVRSYKLIFNDSDIY
ncbi:regucalcin-like [Colias croceus]|uniref:regucalcin-like n=1 Tax=Colias crocea TaxID=72248 RepID=UPI001E2805D1|nr:regucalcin-like [Colias croceus]